MLIGLSRVTGRQGVHSIAFCLGIAAWIVFAVCRRDVWDDLRDIVVTRLRGCSVQLGDGRLVEVTIAGGDAGEDGRGVTVLALDFHGVMVSLDGGVLPVVPIGIRQYEGDWQSAGSIPRSVRDQWEELYGWVSGGMDVACVYMALLHEARGGCNSDAVGAAVLLEQRRLVRDIALPWTTWELIGRQAQLLRRAAKVVGAPDVEISCDQMLHSCAQVQAWRRESGEGRLSRVDAVCLAELESGDGRLSRQSYLRIAGAYSGGWAFKGLSKMELRGLACYWNSKLWTRYVVAAGPRCWTAITLGERVQEIAGRMMGRPGTVEEYLEWLDNA